MRNIGTIRIGIKQDLYKTDINHVTAEKIDFFSLTLLEIIQHANMYKNVSIADVLLSIDVPKDMHNIFEESLNEMIQDNPPLVRAFCNCSLDNDVSNYFLTVEGRQTYISQELFSKEKTCSIELIFDVIQKSIKRESESIVIPKNEIEDLIVLTPNTIEENEIQKVFDSIIKKRIDKYIPYSTDKTKITKVKIISLCEKIIQDKIDIIVNNEGRVEFFNKNPEVTQLFVNNLSSPKNVLKFQKAFEYFENIPLQKVDLNNVRLVESKRLHKLDMKVVWGDEKSLSLLEHKIYYASQKTPVKKCGECTFAGITTTNKYIVYKYTKYEQNGIPIPLEEVDQSEVSYSRVFSTVWENNKNILDSSFVEFSVLAAPSSKKSELINYIAKENNNSNDIINKLLSLDEESTIKELDLVKKYNELIEKEKVYTLKHKCDLYNRYLLFEDQYRKLNLLRSDDFSAYKTEKWDAFQKNIEEFKNTFEGIKVHLEKSFSKRIKDFISDIEDIYYSKSPVPTNAVLPSENKNWHKELNKSINSEKNPNYIAIAAVLRTHYEEKLNQLDKNPNLNLKGKEKIYSIISDEKNAREFYVNWKNLSVIIHNTDKSHFLLRGDQKEKRKALNNAIGFYKGVLEHLK